MSNTTSISRRTFLGTCVSVAVANLLDGDKAKVTGPPSDWQALREDPVCRKIAGSRISTDPGPVPAHHGEAGLRSAGDRREHQAAPASPADQHGPSFPGLVGQDRPRPHRRNISRRPSQVRVGDLCPGRWHDGFPPTIIAAVDALSAWGMNRRAAQLFRYWLANFVRENGTIKYYGPSISEYGQLLHTAALLEERAGPAGWWAEGYKALDRMAEFLLQLQAAAARRTTVSSRGCLKRTPGRTSASISTTTPGPSRGFGGGPICASDRRLRRQPRFPR